MNSDQQKQLKSLQNVEEGLTDWEITFIDDLSNNYQDQELSTKQAARLQKLYEVKGL